MRGREVVPYDAIATGAAAAGEGVRGASGARGSVQPLRIPTFVLTQVCPPRSVKEDEQASQHCVRGESAGVWIKDMRDIAGKARALWGANASKSARAYF